MTFPLDGIMRTPSPDIDAELARLRRALEARRADAKHALAEQRLKDELNAKREA